MRAEPFSAAADMGDVFLPQINSKTVGEAVSDKEFTATASLAFGRVDPSARASARQIQSVRDRYFQLRVESTPNEATVTFRSAASEHRVITNSEIDLARGIWDYSVRKLGFAPYDNELDLRQRRNGKLSGTLDCTLRENRSTCDLRD